MKHIKCIFVGDGAVGKNEVLISYTTNAYPGEYIPTIFDNYSANVMVEDQAINLQLWDTAGQEDYKKIRPLSYPKTDVFVVAFSLVSPTSLENVENMWIPEIQEHCPETPYILLGLKKSLRDEFPLHEDEYNSKGWAPVSTATGEEMKRKISAAYYIECDASKQINLKETFELAIKCVLHRSDYETLSQRERRLERERLERIQAEKRAEKERRKAEKHRIKEEKKAEKARRKEEKKSEKLRIKAQKQEEKNHKIEETEEIKTKDETKEEKKKLHISFHFSCNISFD